MEADTPAASKAELWRQRIEAQRSSGQRVRAWCRANAIAEHSFYFWRARLGLFSGNRRRLVGNRPASAKATPAGFAEVLISAQEGLRLRLACGRELVLPASLAMARVAELILALEQANASDLEANASNSQVRSSHKKAGGQACRDRA